MNVLPDSHENSKGDAAAPPSRRQDPAAVVPLPTALTPKQRHQQAARCQHGEDARPFKARLPALVGHADANHYPILSRHWPNLSTPQTPCKSTPFRHGAFRADAVPFGRIPRPPTSA